VSVSYIQVQRYVAVCVKHYRALDINIVTDWLTDELTNKFHAAESQLAVPQIFHKFLAFYEARKLRTVFIKSLHLSVSEASSIHYTPSTLFLEDTF
jgi:hypothetical protein